MRSTSRRGKKPVRRNRVWGAGGMNEVSVLVEESSQWGKD